MEFEEKKLQKRKEKALSQGNREQIAEACNNLGDFYNQTGRYVEATEQYKENVSIYQKLGPKHVLKMAKSQRMVGEMFMLLSEFDNALKHINIYLKHAQNLGNKIEEQRAYATLGRAYLLYGQSNNDVSMISKQLRNAEKAFIKSLLIVKELTGQISKHELLDMQARLYLNIGVAKEHMGDFEEAVNYKEKAVKICKANDMFEVLHLCYISLSLLYQFKKNDSCIALRFCNLALEIAERLPEKVKKICETLLTKAEILTREGDFQSAKKVLLKAYKMKSTELNDRQNIENNLKIIAAICYTLQTLTTTSLENYNARKILYEKMGDGSCQLQNYSKAIEYYLQALECAEKNGDSIKQLIPIYVSLYQTYKDNKEYDKSLEYLWKEYEANKDEPLEAASTLYNIAEVYELQMKPFWTIYEVYQRALNESKKYQGNNKIWKDILIKEYKLALKYNMNSVADDIKDESLKENMNFEKILDDDDANSEVATIENDTPDIGQEIDLDDLTDSNSEAEEGDNLRRTRKRGGICLTIKRNNKGETQLHQACISGNLNLASRLIDQGHAVNVRDHAGWLPLHEACNHGFRDIVELLLDKGAVSAINDKGGTNCDGITPLYDACSNGYLDVAELLLERGANSTLKNDFGDTTLSILEKWRNSNDLNYDEQMQYERIYSKIAFEFSKIGEKTNLSPMSSLLKSKDNSIEKLKDMAYSDVDSDIQSDDELSENGNISIPRSSQLSVNSNENLVPSRRSFEKNTISRKASVDQKFNAKVEYKNVMKNLKHPNRKINTLSSEITTPKKRRALLEENEVGENWLEDDLGPNKKKHKLTLDYKIYSTDPTVPLNSSKKGNRSSKHTEDYYTLPTPKKISQSSDSSDSENINKPNAFSVLFDNGKKPSNCESKLVRRARRTSSSSDKNNVGSYQSSLFQKGFCRFRNDNQNHENSTDHTIEIEPDSTTAIYETSRDKHNNVIASSPQKINQTISFRIKVEEELLLVPVERSKTCELNIKWLAEEASRRYYNLIGLKPILRLMTADGFAFEETDTINVAVDENMISSKVLDWDISPLSERYEEMCFQLNQEIDEIIKLTLEKSQVSNVLSLEEWALTPNLTEPIFKALLHQSTLRTLDLSNCFIQNDGCKQLGKSLLTLNQLKNLNLQGNCITSEGLGYLIRSQSTNTQIQFCELENLNLSFNPLGDRSLTNLETLCKISSKLNTLNLQSCKLINIYEYDLKFNKLIDFNISFNNLSESSINKIFDNLNSCQLQRLVMNFTSTKNFNFGIKFYEFLTKGTNENLKEIQIADCNLTDSDVYKIVKLFNKCLKLELINLSNNIRLTGLSFKYIFENLVKINKIIFDECEHIIEISKLQNLNFNNHTEFPHLISLHLNKTHQSDIENFSMKKDFLKDFWYNCHAENGKIFCRENYVCLYVNEKDLNLFSKNCLE